jgi:hypothetical protein
LKSNVVRSNEIQSAAYPRTMAKAAGWAAA